MLKTNTAKIEVSRLLEYPLDIKRCYLPIIITADCPECGLSVTKYCNTDYLSYPKLNVPIKVPMHHCDEVEDGMVLEHEFEVTIKLGITAELV